MANSFTAEEAAALRARGGHNPAPPAASPQATAPADSAPAADSPPDAPAVPADAPAADTTTEAPAPSDIVATGDDTAPAEDEGSATSEPKPPKGSASARIQELIEERNALRAYGRHLEGRLTEGLRPAAPAAPAAPAPVAAPTEMPPKLEDFKYDASAHAKALGEWTQEQVDARVAAGVEAKLAEQRAASARQTFEARVDAFAAVTPDFHAVISNPNLPNLHQRAAERVVGHESGPAIAYHLAKNPDLALRISRLDADSQLVAIGRIVASLEAPATAGSKQKTSAAPAASRAPAPPRPVSSGSSPGKDPNAPSASMSEFVAAHRAKSRRQPARGRR